MWFVQWSFWKLVAFVIEDSILSDIIKHQHNFAKDTLNIVDDSHSFKLLKSSYWRDYSDSAWRLLHVKADIYSRQAAPGGGPDEEGAVQAEHGLLPAGRQDGGDIC